MDQPSTQHLSQERRGGRRHRPVTNETLKLQVRCHLLAGWLGMPQDPEEAEVKDSQGQAGSPGGLLQEEGVGGVKCRGRQSEHDL